MQNYFIKVNCAPHIAQRITNNFILEQLNYEARQFESQTFASIHLTSITMNFVF